MQTPRLCLSVAAALALVACGCGSPGEPLPPLLNIPGRTTDLQAMQRAAELILQWTVPSQTTEGFPLKDLERVVVLGREVDRNSIDSSEFDSGAREILVMEDPAAGQRFERRLALPAPAGRRFAVATKNYSFRRRSGGLSNIVVVEIAPVLPPPQTLRVISQVSAIRLEWPRIPGAWGYRIYRSTADQPQFAFVTAIQFPPFDDTNFVWDKSYSYFVRAYAEVSSGIAESADSPVAAVVPRDVFPPSPPAGLQSVVSEMSVELSWNLSPEPDTAGYYVYRRNAAGQTARLNTELLTAPVFSDKTVQRHEQYSYSVSAVDEKGNESAPTAPLTVTIP